MVIKHISITQILSLVLRAGKWKNELYVCPAEGDSGWRREHQDVGQKLAKILR